MSSTSLWSVFKKTFADPFTALGLVGILFFSFALSGCDNPQKTIETLRLEIAAYKTTPDDKKQLEIEQNFVKLETQVEDLQKKNDAKADDYARQLVSLRTEYQSAKMGKALNDAKKALEGFGEALKSGVQSVGDAIRGTNSTNE